MICEGAQYSFTTIFLRAISSIRSSPGTHISGVITPRSEMRPSTIICAMMLVDLGADVIKVEDPDGGDYVRWMGPQIGGQSVFCVGDIGDCAYLIEEGAVEIVSSDLGREQRIGLLPVVDQYGKPGGVLRLSDLLALELPDSFDLLPDLDFVHDFGAVETTRPTYHTDPTYIIDGVVHYCVANMPGAVAKTSTLALTNATLPYAVEIADKGWKRAMKENAEIKKGANVVQGQVTFKGVADAFGLHLTDIDTLL